MVGYRVFFDAEQLCHLRLRQPHRFVFQTHFQLHHLVRLVQYDFSFFFIFHSSFCFYCFCRAAKVAIKSV